MLVGKVVRENTKLEGIAAPEDYECGLYLPGLYFLVDESDDDANLAVNYWRLQDYRTTRRALTEDKQLTCRPVGSAKQVTFELGKHVFLWSADLHIELERRLPSIDTPSYTPLKFLATVLVKHGEQKVEERARVCLDTGSCVSAITEAFVKRLDLPLTEKHKTFSTLAGYVHTTHVATVDVNVGGKTVSVSARVVRQDLFGDDLLLGTDVLKGCESMRIGLFRGGGAWIRLGKGRRVQAAISSPRLRILEESKE